MHRRTAFAAAVAALVVAVVLGAAPAASAASDQHPTNRGWVPAATEVGVRGRRRQPLRRRLRRPASTTGPSATGFAGTAAAARTLRRGGGPCPGQGVESRLVARRRASSRRRPSAGRSPRPPRRTRPAGPRRPARRPPRPSPPPTATPSPPPAARRPPAAAPSRRPSGPARPQRVLDAVRAGGGGHGQPDRRHRLALQREAGLERAGRAQRRAEHARVERAAGEQVGHRRRPPRPDSHSTVWPRSHAGGPMIAPSTTRSGPSSSAMACTVSGRDGVGVDVERRLGRSAERRGDLLGHRPGRVRRADRDDHVGAAGQLGDVRHARRDRPARPASTWRRCVRQRPRSPRRRGPSAPSRWPRPSAPGCSTPTTGRAGISRTPASKQTGGPR